MVPQSIDQGVSLLLTQLYDIYVDFLKYFPGPHTKIDDMFVIMRDFVAKKVKQNQETLDPNCPRDFIDCFLIQMEKVGSLQGKGV